MCAHRHVHTAVSAFSAGRLLVRESGTVTLPVVFTLPV